MAATGISIPDDVMDIVDSAKDKWRTTRSKAFVRIILEWSEDRTREENKTLSQQKQKPQAMAA